ncbi:MAG: PEP-CTERM sorting domain-containing protein [Rubrivivax sp.]|nr:PEP-CTERM sorting domain-containing protein [Rubrivivax sp.]
MFWKLPAGRVWPALSLALAAWMASPAQAAVVVASFDPAFGAAIPNLGFRGTAEFSIADACFARTGLVLNSDACSGNTMRVLGAEVTFYNLADPETPLQTSTWSGSSFNVLAGLFAGGQLVGLDTTISLPLPVVIQQSGAQAVSFSGLMAVQFYSGQLGGEDDDEEEEGGYGARGSLGAHSSSSSDPAGGTRLFTCAVGSVGACNVLAQSNAATVSYETVPEPATALLALLALGAGAAARRARPAA